jgi:hypothetical protein
MMPGSDATFCDEPRAPAPCIRRNRALRRRSVAARARRDAQSHPFRHVADASAIFRNCDAAHIRFVRAISNCRGGSG